MDRDYWTTIHFRFSVHRIKYSEKQKDCTALMNESISLAAAQTTITPTTSATAHISSMRLWNVHSGSSFLALKKYDQPMQRASDNISFSFDFIFSAGIQLCLAHFVDCLSACVPWAARALKFSHVFPSNHCFSCFSCLNLFFYAQHGFQTLGFPASFGLFAGMFTLLPRKVGQLLSSSLFSLSHGLRYFTNIMPHPGGCLGPACGRKLWSPWKIFTYQSHESSVFSFPIGPFSPIIRKIYLFPVCGQQISACQLCQVESSWITSHISFALV